MRLTPVQREVLLTLVDLYHMSKGKTVKGEYIAGSINKNPGTIRNQMQSLSSLGLVEGVPGLKDGYRPMIEEYQILNFIKLEKETEAPVIIRGKPIMVRNQLGG
jgi:predicted transcriptional regulator